MPDLSHRSAFSRSSSNNCIGSRTVSANGGAVASVPPVRRRVSRHRERTCSSTRASARASACRRGRRRTDTLLEASLSDSLKVRRVGLLGLLRWAHRALAANRPRSSPPGRKDPTRTGNSTSAPPAAANSSSGLTRTLTPGEMDRCASAAARAGLASSAATARTRIAPSSRATGASATISNGSTNRPGKPSAARTACAAYSLCRPLCRRMGRTRTGNTSAARTGPATTSSGPTRLRKNACLARPARSALR
mmetsp:Transcript_27677/g.80216  ORF Transcript_27677/g.80216 Transcript_27677/m.80216 type:complete len:250 (-) Transcript_27677:725-1474(-)